MFKNKKILETLNSKKTEMLNEISKVVFEEYSEFFIENSEEMVFPEYITRICNYGIPKELYEEIANDMFKQNLDFSGKNKNDLFFDFLEELNKIFKKEILESEEFSELCENFGIIAKEFLEKVSIFFGTTEDGFGLLIKHCETF